MNRSYCIKYIYGVSHKRVYRIWNSMIERCTNANNQNFHRYGGRGISVCLRWMYFWNFYKDMGDPPPNKSLERLNNDKDYYPENCTWASRHWQSHNRRAKGYYFDKKNQKYRAQIMVCGNRKSLGYFNTAEEAELAYEEEKNKREEFLKGIKNSKKAHK